MKKLKNKPTLKHEVSPTDWDMPKTEDIDFDTPFIWLDDAVFKYEQNKLRK